MSVMCSLDQREQRDAFLEALPHELKYHQVPFYVWHHLVILFTWAGTMLWRWPGSYPNIARMLSLYVRMVEEDIVKMGGWDGISQQFMHT